MTTGAGFSAAGFSPAGFGDAAEFPAPATTNLIDAKGVQQSARAIDAPTGQYILNEDGRFQGMDRVEQLVILRVRAMTLPAGDVTSDLSQRIRTLLAATLADLVNQNLIAIIDVVSGAELPTRQRGALKFRNLTTNREVLVPL
jgi:hypothetical protein